MKNRTIRKANWNPKEGNRLVSELRKKEKDINARRNSLQNLYPNLNKDLKDAGADIVKRDSWKSPMIKKLSEWLKEGFRPFVMPEFSGFPVTVRYDNGKVNIRTMVAVCTELEWSGVRVDSVVRMMERWQKR
jgi:hypothetical protein